MGEIDSTAESRGVSEWPRMVWDRFRSAIESVAGYCLTSRERVPTAEAFTRIDVDTIETGMQYLTSEQITNGVYIVDIDNVLNEGPLAPALHYLARKSHNAMARARGRREDVRDRRDPVPYMLALGIDTEKVKRVVLFIRTQDPKATIFFASARTNYPETERTRVRGGFFRGMARLSRQAAGFDWASQIQKAISEITNISEAPIVQSQVLSIAPDDFAKFEQTMGKSYAEPQIIIVRNVAKSGFERELQVWFGARTNAQKAINHTPAALLSMAQFNLPPGATRTVIVIDDKKIPALSGVAQTGHRVIHLRVKSYDPDAQISDTAVE